MHYGLLVVLSRNGDDAAKDIKTRVADELQPYGDGLKWDWYQIGGRWTGTLSGYKPDDDPANVETCDLCGGTGDRATFRNEPKENQHQTGCNGCLGKGKRVTWPTRWKDHEGDVQPITAVTQDILDQNFHAVVAEGYGWLGGEDYIPWKSEFQKREKPPIAWLHNEFKDGIAVVVDIHN